jgi:hypothetical protein
MDMWQSYEKRRLATDFGTSRILLSSGERWNASLNWVAPKAVNLESNATIKLKYTEQARYIIAKDILEDLLVTAYDVNSFYCFAARITDEMPHKIIRELNAFRKELRNPNVEMRFIGFQNGARNLTQHIDSIKRLNIGHSAEFDLFGADRRHIVMDTKVGKPYNLLLLNRLYRPGELSTIVLKPQPAPSPPSSQPPNSPRQQDKEAQAPPTNKA